MVSVSSVFSIYNNQIDNNLNLKLFIWCFVLSFGALGMAFFLWRAEAFPKIRFALIIVAICFMLRGALAIFDIKYFS